MGEILKTDQNTASGDSFSEEKQNDNLHKK